MLAMERFQTSSLKLHFSSHDLGRVFKVLKILRFLLSPCNRILLLHSTKRRAFISSGKTLTKDVSLFVFMAYNVLLFVIGLVSVLLGVALFVVYSLTHPFANGHIYLSLGMLIMLAGISILIMSLVGFVGATTSERRILRVYLALALIAVILAALVVFIIFKVPTIDKSYFLMLLGDFIKTYRHPSDNQYHSPVINGIVDFAQSKGNCCGARGPTDWALLNFVYLDQYGGHFPDSCVCNVSHHNEVCKRIVLPYASSKGLYQPINESMWSLGCGEKLSSAVAEIKPVILKCNVALILAQVTIIFITVYLLMKRRTFSVHHLS